MLQKSPLQKTMHKTRAGAKKKKNGPQHPFDKRIAVRGKIPEAAVEPKALIKAIVDFIKTVLPHTTLIDTPKRESVELGTQIGLLRTRSVPLPSTGEVYEAETSPVSTAAAIASDDDDDGEISEGDVHAFARK
jgi:hypothetical protein